MDDRRRASRHVDRCVTVQHRSFLVLLARVRDLTAPRMFLLRPGCLLADQATILSHRIALVRVT